MYSVKDKPTSSKSEKEKGVLEGNLTIYDSIVRVLFDTGATHSFISQQAINELNIEPDFVDEPICVRNPVGGPANLCLRCRDVPISYSCHQFPISPFVLDFNEFEVLLGMDWLAKYEAKLDCNNRLISIKTEFGDFIKISCEDPSPKREGLMYNLGYPEPSLESIPVVRDFPDVFEEVKSLPPHREIEFRIDLIPNPILSFMQVAGWHLGKGLN